MSRARGWGSVKLEEVMASRTGSVDPSKFPNEEFDLYSIPAFDKGEHEITRGDQIGSSKQIVQPQDVLLSKIVPHIRRAWIVGPQNGRRLIASGEWIVFRDARFDPKYLKHLLTSDYFHPQFMATVAGVGGSLLRARPAQVGQISIPLPPLPEQKRIAAILDSSDAIRQKRKAAIAKLDDLAQSVFLEMFGDPTTNPKKWKVRKIAELTEDTQNWNPEKDDPDGMLYYIDIGKVDSSTKEITPLTPITCLGAPSRARQKVQVGDVLVSTVRPNLNAVAIIRSDYPNLTASTGFCVLRPNMIVTNTDFLFSWVRTKNFVKKMTDQATGASYPAISDKIIKTSDIYLPPLDLQDHFSEIIRNMTSVTMMNWSSLEKEEILFSSLQHRAFAGEL